MARQATARVDRALGSAAVVVSIASFIALGLAVGLGLAGNTVPLFTYVAMIGFPVAFLLLVAVLLRAIGRRRHV